MACRGCSSSDGCGCSVTGDGAAISVTGTGTPVTSPYVVSFDLADALAEITVETDGCDTLDDPHVPVLQGDGSVVMFPLPCNEALNFPPSGQAFAFTFDTNTTLMTPSVPASGYLRLNNVNPASVTFIYVSDEEYYGTDISAWVLALDDISAYPRGMIKVYSRTDTSAWASYRLTATAAGPPDVYQLIVTYVDHSGTFSDEVPGDIVLDFAPASEGSLGGFDSIQTILTVNTAYTLGIADVGSYIRAEDNAPFSITVPDEATEGWVAGSHVDIIQVDTGTISIVGDVGVTINANPGTDLNGQWASATLIYVGGDEWDLVGNLSA